MFWDVGPGFCRDVVPLAHQSFLAALDSSQPHAESRRCRCKHKSEDTTRHCWQPNLVPRPKFRSLSREGRLAMSGCLLDPARLPGIVPWVHVLPSLTSAAGVFSQYANLASK